MRNYFWMGFIGLLPLMSCEKIIPLELPEKASKLVVNCILNPDSLVRVYVYQSQALLAPREASFLRNATVMLSENGQFIDSIPFNPQSNTYLSPTFRPKPGHTYHLLVSAPGFEVASATCQLPDFVSIMHAEAKDSAGIDEYGYYYAQLKVQFTDPEGTRNFYGLMGTMPYTYTRLQPSQPGQPIQRDTVRIEGNIYLYSTTSLVEDTYGSGVVFTDDLFNGKTHELVMNFFPSQRFSGSAKDSSHRQLLLRLKHTDEFYYEYNRKLAKHLNNRDGGIFAGEPISVPNNITNGYGIFSGYSQAQVKIQLEGQGK